MGGRAAGGWRSSPCLHSVEGRRAHVPLRFFTFHLLQQFTRPIGPGRGQTKRGGAAHFNLILAGSFAQNLITFFAAIGQQLCHQLLPVFVEFQQQANHQLGGRSRSIARDGADGTHRGIADFDVGIFQRGVEEGQIILASQLS